MILKKGSIGLEVEKLQKQLVSLGFDLGPIDGIYGQRTQAAVIEFQQSKNLTPDGIVGPITFDALFPQNKGTVKTPDFVYLWDNCEIDLDRIDQVKKYCGIINEHRESYINVAKIIATQATDIDLLWHLIAALHYRESTLNFKTYLGNGQLLNRVTTIVPKGRGPFSNWTEGAIDALKLEGFDHIEFKTIYQCLIMAEKYNGLGYRLNGVYSPYVWAGTNMSDELGKYTSDGHYDPLKHETQLGVAAILKGLTHYNS